jgi:DNA-binding GntR family transcriptional regulator
MSFQKQANEYLDAIERGDVTAAEDVLREMAQYGRLAIQDFEHRVTLSILAQARLTFT